MNDVNVYIYKRYSMIFLHKIFTFVYAYSLRFRQLHKLNISSVVLRSIEILTTLLQNVVQHSILDENHPSTTTISR